MLLCPPSRDEFINEEMFSIAVMRTTIPLQKELMTRYSSMPTDRETTMTKMRRTQQRIMILLKEGMRVVVFFDVIGLYDALSIPRHPGDIRTVIPRTVLEAALISDVIKTCLWVEPRRCDGCGRAGLWHYHCEQCFQLLYCSHWCRRHHAATHRAGCEGNLVPPEEMPRILRDIMRLLVLIGWKDDEGVCSKDGSTS